MYDEVYFLWTSVAKSSYLLTYRKILTHYYLRVEISTVLPEFPLKKNTSWKKFHMSAARVYESVEYESLS